MNFHDGCENWKPAVTCTTMFCRIGHMTAQIAELFAMVLSAFKGRLVTLRQHCLPNRWSTIQPKAPEHLTYVKISFEGNFGTYDWRLGNDLYRPSAVMQFPWFLLLLFYALKKFRGVVNNNSYIVGNRTQYNSNHRYLSSLRRPPYGVQNRQR